jgi:hypothetical protein
MLKVILKDEDCNMNQDIEEAITVGGNHLTFDDMQGSLRTG